MKLVQLNVVGQTLARPQYSVIVANPQNLRPSWLLLNYQLTLVDFKIIMDESSNVTYIDSLISNRQLFPTPWCTAKKIRFMFSKKKKLRGLSPNFHIHVSVSDFYIPTIGLPILL